MGRNSESGAGLALAERGIEEAGDEPSQTHYEDIEEEIPDSERKRLKPSKVSTRLQVPGARRNLDGMNNSIFEPGGSNSAHTERLPGSPSGLGILHDEIWERQRITREFNEAEKRRFEEDKNKDIAELKEKNRQLDKEVRDLKTGKGGDNEKRTAELKRDIKEMNSQRKTCETELYEEAQRAKTIREDNAKQLNIEKLEIEAASKQLQDIRKLTEREEERVNNLIKQSSGLLEENRGQIENNEIVRNEILRDNQSLLDRQKQIHQSVTDLKSKKSILENYINTVESKTGKPDMSVILNPNGYDLHTNGADKRDNISPNETSTPA